VNLDGVEEETSASKEKVADASIAEVEALLLSQNFVIEVDQEC